MLRAPAGSAGCRLHRALASLQIVRRAVTPASGALTRTAFAHDGAVIRLLYTPDGSELYSSSEDRTVKRWDAELDLYRSARKQGIQPDGTKTSKIMAALKAGK